MADISDSPSFGASLANTALSFAQMGMQQKFASASEERNYRRNLNLMKLQNDFNIDMWNRANVYNSPSNQIRLLRDAGINPAVFDANSANSTASEVVSADADVPYNTQSAELFTPVSQTLSALYQEAQISKLRNEIKYQDMVNEDFKMLLDSHKMELMRYEEPHDAVVDSAGNPVIVSLSSAPRNYYQRKMLDERDDRQDVLLNRRQRREEFAVYSANAPFLKRMSEQQLKGLIEDLRAKVATNTLLEEDVQMMKKYGISSRDTNQWTTLLRATLRNPDAVYNVIERLIDSGSRAGSRLFDRILKGRFSSHSNPSSW